MKTLKRLQEKRRHQAFKNKKRSTQPPAIWPGPVEGKESVAGNDESAAAPAPGLKLRVEKAVTRVSRRVPSSALGEKGIQKIRVLSESRLAALVEELVNARLRESESRRAQFAPQPLHDGNATSLRAQCEHRWMEYQRSREQRLRSMAERMSGLQGTFESLESSIRELVALLGDVGDTGDVAADGNGEPSDGGV